MATAQTATEWRGRTAVDRDGDKIGTIEEIYLDARTGKPEWLLVKTGMFGMRSTFVPLEGAEATADAVRVPFEKGQVKDAPNVDADHELSQEEEQHIYSHYGLDYGESRSESGLPEGDATGAAGTTDTAATGGAEGRDVSGPTTDEAMTRSEEELRVGTERRERGRARLRKYVVTEEVTKTVPVQREEVRVETEPITEGNVDQALDGPEISEEEHEVVLHEEQPVVEKRAVPKERVRLGTEQISDEQQVSEQVRKERIETEGDVRD